MRNKILILIILLISYNLIFFLQVLLKSELNFYLLGFRLNLFLLVNLIILYFNRDKLPNMIDYFKKIGKFKNWVTVFIIPILLTLITLLVLNFISVPLKYEKPQFLIEFGFSSILDLPIYYLWNLPFLISVLMIWILLYSESKLIRAFGVSLILSLTCIMANNNLISGDLDLKNLSFILLIFSMIFFNCSVLKFFQSFWLTVFSILISIYAYVLFFGSSNTFVIKTFFARMYSDWPGIFVIKKNYAEFIDFIFAGFMILFAVLFFIFDKKKSFNS